MNEKHCEKGATDGPAIQQHLLNQILITNSDSFAKPLNSVSVCSGKTATYQTKSKPQIQGLQILVDAPNTSLRHELKSFKSEIRIDLGFDNLSLQQILALFSKQTSRSFKIQTMNCVVTERKELDKIAATHRELRNLLHHFVTCKPIKSRRHAKCNGYSKFCIGGAGILRLNRQTTKVAILTLVYRS